MINNSRFYTYLHRKLSDGSVFYVGKGSGKRAWSSLGRNDYWKRVVNKHGFSVEIVLDNIQEFTALMIEKGLIASYREDGVALTNLTDGGEHFTHSSISKLKMSEAKIGKPLLEGTKIKISNTLKGKCRPESVKVKISKSKKISPHLTYFQSGISHPKSDTSLYTFKNKLSNTCFTGTRDDLSKEFNIPKRNLSVLFLAIPRKSCFGWSLIKETNDNSDQS